MNKQIKTLLAMTFISILTITYVGCGQTQNQSENQGETQSEQQEESINEFSPKYAADTEYRVSVMGSYSNFESLYLSHLKSKLHI